MTLIGFCILILQLNYAEPDYLNRIGIYKINFNEKLKIIQIFIKKYFSLKFWQSSYYVLLQDIITKT